MTEIGSGIEKNRVPGYPRGALLGTAVLLVNLQGCVAAVIPLMMAGAVGVVALTGFAVYKTVQTTGGGTMQIEFGSADAKHAAPPAPLPTAGSLAVWPGGMREQKFAEVISASGKIRVATITGTQALSASDGERSKGYADICRNNKVDMVFAAVDQGQTVKSNLMSFKRGAVTDKFTLEGYGCEAGKVVWTDTMATVIESGSKPTPQAEIDAAAGQSWAERVLQAKSGG